MSDTDSFIEEVTEEVRRDRLFALYKRYGWIAALLVVLLVGGAAAIEFRKAQRAATAQSLGDALLDAADESDAAARAAALARVEVAGEAAVVPDLLRAAIAVDADPADAIAALREISANAESGSLYQQIADLKLVMLEGANRTTEDRLATLAALSAPGAPFRHLAMEQQAMIMVETGDRDGAISLLLGLLEEQGVSAGLRQRASQLIVALGGELDAG